MSNNDQQYLTSTGSCHPFQPIQKVQNSARHRGMQWFGTIHKPTLPLSQSEASIEPLESIIKKEASVYIWSPLCRLSLPQRVAGCLQNKDNSHFINRLCGSQFSSNLLNWRLKLSPFSGAHWSQRSEDRLSYQGQAPLVRGGRWGGGVGRTIREGIFLSKGDSH